MPGQALFYSLPIRVYSLLMSLDSYPSSMQLMNPVVTSQSPIDDSISAVSLRVMYVLCNPNLATRAVCVMAASAVCGSSEEEVEVVF